MMNINNFSFQGYNRVKSYIASQGKPLFSNSLVITQVEVQNRYLFSLFIESLD